MFGSLGGARFDVSVAELAEMVAAAPGDTGAYRARILSVQQTGDAAVTVVREEGHWRSVAFIDYLGLSRLEGAWTIVNKRFARQRLTTSFR